MSPFRSGTIIVGDRFDSVHDDLLFEIVQERPYCEGLSREEVIRLRDHLNKVLGVAS